MKDAIGRKMMDGYVEFICCVPNSENEEKLLLNYDEDDVVSLLINRGQMCKNNVLEIIKSNKIHTVFTIPLKDFLLDSDEYNKLYLWDGAEWWFKNKGEELNRLSSKLGVCDVCTNRFDEKLITCNSCDNTHCSICKGSLGKCLICDEMDRDDEEEF